MVNEQDVDAWVANLRERLGDTGCLPGRYPFPAGATLDLFTAVGGHRIVYASGASGLLVAADESVVVVFTAELVANVRLSNAPASASWHVDVRARRALSRVRHEGAAEFVLQFGSSDRVRVRSDAAGWVDLYSGLLNDLQRA